MIAQGNRQETVWIFYTAMIEQGNHNWVLIPKHLGLASNSINTFQL